MPQFGIVLPSWLYNQERRELADAAFRSLAKTKLLEPRAMLLLLVKAGTAGDYTEYMELLSKSFTVILKTDEGLSGTEQTLAFGTQWLIDQHCCDFVTWMGDDALFHPDWLLELRGLVMRHPDARSWSVYRSNHERFHAPLREMNYGGSADVLVRSICGHGLTMTSKEWHDWGIQWQTGHWVGGGGDTLDLVHWAVRPGERWVTKKSYIEHTGWKKGMHCTGGEKEYAQEFVGVE